MDASRPPAAATAAVSCAAASAAASRASECWLLGSRLLRSVPLNRTGSCNHESSSLTRYAKTQLPIDHFVPAQAKMLVVLQYLWDDCKL